jgi:hypothetical protein
MENPYPNDDTIQSFINLYASFLESSQEELMEYQTSLKIAQQKLDVAGMAMKSFEEHIWDRLTDIIRRLPVSKCRFCGGVVIDKTPLRQFAEQLRPLPGDSTRYWLNFRNAERSRLYPECQSCRIFSIGSEEYSRISLKGWFRNSLRKPKFITILFIKYPFVSAFSETETPFHWTFTLDNGEYWCFDGTREQVISQYGLTDDLAPEGHTE